MSTATDVILDAHTEAEITDARLDTIARAREVLERAISEHGAWRGDESLFRVTAAMGALEGALRSWDWDEIARWTEHVITVTGDVMGPEAAAYVSGTEGGEGA